MGLDRSRPVPTFEEDRPTQRRTLRRCRVVSVVCAMCLGAGQLRVKKWYPGRAPMETCPDCGGTGIDKEDA